MFIKSKSRVLINSVFRSKNMVLLKIMFFVDKLCLSTWKTMFFRNSAFHSINLGSRDKLCFSNEKQCFSIEKHCLSAINSVFRFITHLACHSFLQLCLTNINQIQNTTKFSQDKKKSKPDIIVHHIRIAFSYVWSNLFPTVNYNSFIEIHVLQSPKYFIRSQNKRCFPII